MMMNLVAQSTLLLLLSLCSAPAQEFLKPLKSPLATPSADATRELTLSRDDGAETDPIFRIYGDYPSTTGSLGRLMGNRKAPGYRDPEGKVIALEVLKNGDVLFGPNLGIARRPANDKDPSARSETDPQHCSPIDFWWDARDRKLHVRSILLTENGDPPDLAFRRSGDETYPYGAPLAIKAGTNLGTMYWMGWGAKDHGFDDRVAQIHAKSAEDITEHGAGGTLHFSTTPIGATKPVERVVIGSEGGVGIGTPVPQARLHITAESASIADDYAASEKLEAGDVVSIDENARALAMRKATSAYDRKIAGVVVSQPALRLSHPADAVNTSAYPIAHGGRAAVKVHGENGAIRAGDYLTSSTTAGVAMRATAKGPVVGKALQAWSGDAVGTIQMLVDVTWYVP